MNHDDKASLDPAQEREWQAQERALRAERLGLDPRGDDVRVRRYRVLSKALRQPPAEALPADFAAQVAALAAPATQPRKTRHGALETALLTSLPGIAVVAGAVALGYDAQAWLPAVRVAVPAVDPQSLRWLLALGGCLGLSWLLERWQRHRQTNS
ncbi:hypothetical protein [Dyella sp. A6]|uniref:hypothetical protein n=1 Tax=Dyella aluminiiresistens TaxID=3069105 RepID=UPI002E77098B|nr:hypothetical protein [Dyella sp. A6]